jgi:hypothetical protein
MSLVRLALADSLVILQYACAPMNPPLSAPPGSSAGAAQHNSEGIAKEGLINSRVPLEKLFMG